MIFQFNKQGLSSVRAGTWLRWVAGPFWRGPRGPRGRAPGRSQAATQLGPRGAGRGCGVGPAACGPKTGQADVGRRCEQSAGCFGVGLPTEVAPAELGRGWVKDCPGGAGALVGVCAPVRGQWGCPCPAPPPRGSAFLVRAVQEAAAALQAPQGGVRPSMRSAPGELTCGPSAPRAPLSTAARALGLVSPSPVVCDGQVAGLPDVARSRLHLAFPSQGVPQVRGGEPQPHRPQVSVLCAAVPTKRRRRVPGYMGRGGGGGFLQTWFLTSVPK